jgi:hypothetical protein
MVSDLIEIPNLDIQAGGASIEGVVDLTNSSTTPLAAGGVFTGLPFEVTEYAAINVNVASNVASATDGVKVQFSTDGVNWDHSHATTYSGATGVGYIFNAEFKFARVVYTNDGSAQAYFRLLTIFKKSAVKQSLYTIVQPVADNMFAELGKNVIIGKTTSGGGGYVAVKVNPSGTMAVEDGTVNSTLGTILTELQLKADLTETQPVSAASLPLPTGASTETTLASVLTELQLKADLTETQPVSAASLPLPTGAATETTLGTILTELQAKADLTETQPVSAASLPLPSGAATETTLGSLLTELQAKADLTETQPVSAASLPLPSGAATETTLAKLPKALVNVEHDQVVNTYVGTSTRIATAEYKLLGTTVATLTFTYDGSNRLVDITRT